MAKTDRRISWTSTAVTAGAGLALLALFNATAASAATRRLRKGARMTVLSDVTFRTLEAGSGQPIVLVHGNAVTAEDWALSGIVDRLAIAHRVIAVDRPGYGLTTRPRDTLWTPDAQASALARLLRARGIGPAIVVGHSLGVQTAIALALDHPDLVLGLVLASGYYTPSPRADAAFAGLAAVPVLGDLLRYTISPVAGHLFSPAALNQMFGPQAVPPEFRRVILSATLRPSQLHAAAADGAYLVPTAIAQSGRLREIRVPVTIVTGTEDRIVTPHVHSQRAARKFSDGELVTLRGAGHMVHYADPNAFIEAIKGNLERATEALSSLRHPLQPLRAHMTS